MIIAILIITFVLFVIYTITNLKPLSPLDELRRVRLTTKSAKELQESREHLQELIQQVEAGDAHACWMVGDCYEHGDIVVGNKYVFPKNKEKALWWKIKAAEDGSGYAQYHLGQMYHFGSSTDSREKQSLVKQNIKEAVKWYRRAAENDEFYALLALGELYLYKYNNEIETEIPQDYKKAFEYISQAIEHKYTKQFGIAATEYGLYNAALKLGEMYASGNGVDQDLIQAYKWLRIGGFDPDTYHKYPLKGKLSESDTKKANELVEEWRKQHSNGL